jgi:metallo-beta-lactamase family protein
MTKITFHGGAGEVTGANFLLEWGEHRVLVDCGLLQRESPGSPENSSAFAYDTSSVHDLLVTHAHADHIGRIPKLVRDGFRGAIHSTAPTKELASLMFDDALSIMQEESLQSPSAMLYEKEDVRQALSLWETHEYRSPFSIGDAEASFQDAGHVLGSAMVRLSRKGRVITFTGDLGNSPEPLLPDTESPAGTHYLVMESVYGDRLHEGKEGRTEALRRAVEDARKRGGTLLIPSFSIERTQILLYELNILVETGRMQPLPVFLDSPLAIRVTDVYRRYAHLLNESVRARMKEGDDPFSFKGLSLTPKTIDSHAIHDAPNPKIIIAGSGMSHGGRVRDHERRYLPSRSSTLLFVGYQSAGSLGRRIQDGAKKVSIDGETVRVRANIQTITGYSGHKDRDALLSFVETSADSLEKVFVALGEPSAALFLAQRIRDFLGVDAVTPSHGDSVEIEW